MAGVILTGNLQDGAKGLAKIKERGGYTVVQYPETAEAHDMPRAAIATTEVDEVLPVTEITPLLIRLCSGKEGRRYGNRAESKYSSG